MVSESIHFSLLSGFSVWFRIVVYWVGSIINRIWVPWLRQFVCIALPPSKLFLKFPNLLCILQCGVLQMVEEYSLYIICSTRQYWLDTVEFVFLFIEIWTVWWTESRPSLVDFIIFWKRWSQEIVLSVILYLWFFIFQIPIENSEKHEIILEIEPSCASFAGIFFLQIAWGQHSWQL